MKTEAERLDRKRMRNLEIYLSGFVLFLLLSVSRFFFRLKDLNSESMGLVVLASLIFNLLLIALSTFESLKLAKRIEHNPMLRKALSDELVRSLEVQSWQAAYFGAISTTIFFCTYLVFLPVM